MTLRLQVGVMSDREDRGSSVKTKEIDNSQTQNKILFKVIPGWGACGVMLSS